MNQTPSSTKNRAAHELCVALAANGIPAVVAGGFCRDYLLGGPIRDIDLYVRIDYFDAVYSYVRNVRDGDAYNQDTVKFFSNNTEEYEHQCIQAQIEFESGPVFKDTYPELAEFPVNLIALRNDTEVQAEIDGEWITDRFNMSLSQAWIDNTGPSVQYRPKFHTDVRMVQNTVLRDDWGHAGTIKAVEKFQKKYPTFTVVNPDGTAWDKKTFLLAAMFGQHGDKSTL